ncbi:MAG: HpaII family restriction endonuclease [Methanobrevibacter sp.]|nr:HpaII family restriction endonuclease [Candidatus Methanoflexus mossambicus]
MTKWKFNKGEWSEAYCFCKLLYEGKVHAGDENLRKIENEYYPILKIIKNEIDSYFSNNTDLDLIEIINLNGNIEKSVEKSKFLKISDDILNKIISEKGSSFEIPILENFLKGLGFIQFKSSSGNKADLIMEIKDLKTDIEKEYSFSIKSELGSKPTILNASNATNFIYQLDGFDDFEAENIMKITKQTDKKWLKIRIAKILELVKRKNYKLKFIKAENSQFENNLKLIDSKLPYLISEILLCFYSHEKLSDIKSLTHHLSEINPLQINENQKFLFYKKNMIELIKASTFYMMPTKPWNGNYDVDGGILTVLKNGNVLLHHIFYNKKQLDEYLFNNTKLETPSSTRYKMGDIYKENENYYFKLNLQIRMK